MTRLQVRKLRILGSIPFRARFFSSPQCPGSLSGPTSLLPQLQSIGTRGFFSWAKCLGYEADHSSPSCVKVMCGIIPPVFFACYLIKKRHHFYSQFGQSQFIILSKCITGHSCFPIVSFFLPEYVSSKFQRKENEKFHMSVIIKDKTERNISYRSSYT